MGTSPDSASPQHEARTGDPRSSTSSPAGAGAHESFDRSHLIGKAHLRRVGRWRFPAFELTQNGEVVARVGRFGWLKIYFGSGQRIELADGERWRIRSMGAAGAIYPVVVDSTGRKVAFAGMANGTYGVNSKKQACVFYSAEPRRIGGGNRWLLSDTSNQLAVVTVSPPSIEAMHPVPLGMVFLCFVVARYGIPGESTPRLPAGGWGKP